MEILNSKFFTSTFAELMLKYIPSSSYYRPNHPPTPHKMPPQIISPRPQLTRHLTRLLRAIIHHSSPAAVLGSFVALQIGTQVECYWLSTGCAFEPPVMSAVVVVVEESGCGEGEGAVVALWGGCVERGLHYSRFWGWGRVWGQWIGLGGEFWSLGAWECVFFLRL